MYQGYRIGAILLMGGSGIRFGGSTPKQFSLLGGKPLYTYALKTFLEAGVFDEIVLICPRDWAENIKQFPKMRLAIGGATRQESSRLGLKAFGKVPEIVLIHDAVRPFVSERILLENLDAAIEWGAADTCIPTADTLVHAPEGEWIASIPKREEFLRGQTPQTFRYEWIVEAHERAVQEGISNVSDDCRLAIDLGRRVAVVRGSEENLKITSEWDLNVAEGLLAIRGEKIEEGKSDGASSDQKGRIDVPACQGGDGEGREDLT